MSSTLFKNQSELNMDEKGKGFNYYNLEVANIWLEISNKPIYIDHLSFLGGGLLK